MPHEQQGQHHQTRPEPVQPVAARQHRDPLRPLDAVVGFVENDGRAVPDQPEQQRRAAPVPQGLVGYEVGRRRKHERPVSHRAFDDDRSAVPRVHHMPILVELGEAARGTAGYTVRESQLHGVGRCRCSSGFLDFGVGDVCAKPAGHADSVFLFVGPAWNGDRSFVLVPTDFGFFFLALIVRAVGVFVVNCFVFLVGALFLVCGSVRLVLVGIVVLFIVFVGSARLERNHDAAAPAHERVDPVGRLHGNGGIVP